LRLAGIVAVHRRPPEHSHRSPNFHGIKEGNGLLLWHADTAVRCRVTRQISSVHSVRSVKSHEVVHRRGDKLSTTRDLHVCVCVGDDRIPARINNFPIYARVMRLLLLEDLEDPRFGQVSIASTRNRRRQNGPPILKQIRHLLLQVDLNGSFRAQQDSCAQEYRDSYNKPHIALKPARVEKVADLHGDWRLD
jgi:hypothetical protein